jgi:hypothetical protein
MTRAMASSKRGRGGRPHRRAVWAVSARAAVAVLLLITVATPAVSNLRLEGRVQWINGEMMILASDEGWSIRIDLARIDQDEYRGLRSGDRVVVTGVPSADWRSVTALSVAPAQFPYQAQGR